MNLREHWRVLLLVVFVVASTFALFAPVGGTGADTGGNSTAINQSDGTSQEAAASTYTRLQYGLDLSGGTQIRAPPVGMMVSGVEFDPEHRTEIERTIQGDLDDVGAGDVRADAGEGTIEVFADPHVGNVTQAEFAAALQEAGIDATEDDVSIGVSAETRDRTVRVLNNKINEGGLAGGTASEVAAPGQRFMLVEVPGADRSEVIELIGDRGRVETVALFPEDTENGTEYRTVSLYDQDAIRTGPADRDPRGVPGVPVTITDEATVDTFIEAMIEFGFTTRPGVENCNYDLNASVEENIEEDPGWCLMTVLDDEVVYAAQMSSGLAQQIESSDFRTDPTYRSQTTSMEDARELELNIRAGALPTELDIDNRGTTYFLAPSLADRFKPLSLLTGAVAVGAVSLMVFLRYRRPEVAIPMLVTAGAEVYILLGFAAAVQLPLDLSHIAGFIAVIGTGVDDLVIIADEIMQQGEVRTSRVFESRFRKAFWVIGAAAATTIIAMSPLAILSLGDLQGFAIVTIIGVLIGVLITRPAYGDILRYLLLE